ncbi:mini-chromosome maintenance complex-binding protein [Mucor ambiguus]|uniref:Mini-chromosome maintenance complex-binding protein n=1 Tax=Mucor ambiguus TaxID=91626 RepID=A0A0C9N496_9FUNG|nr:mini-chromosome maintenance complex-binding protein [Mucor ambiguus]
MSHQIREPLNHISELFGNIIMAQDPSNSPVDFDPSAAFLNVLKTNKEQIISINDTPVQQVPKNTLIRFRCMIQDTGLGQEMFISAYEKLDKNGDMKLHCYRYTDDAIESEFSDQHAMQNEYIAERAIVYCVSPPGESKWVKDAHNANSGSLSDQINQLEIKAPNPTTLNKFPLPGQDHASAIVKFYNEMAENIKVGQLIEIVGIKGQDLQQQQADEHQGFDSVLDMFSNVPVIHAIAFNNLEAINSCPLSNHEHVSQQARDIRNQLISYISSTVGGDTLVAEYILLQLLSRVTVKNRGLKIGNFTLNISGFPAHQTTEVDKKTPLLTLNNPSSKRLADALQNLSIHHVNLPLTIDGLNKTKFSPKSISENLEAGVLQLVDGTVLLVDETVLDEGQLVDPGVRNFQALQNVIQNQTLTYEFPYSQYDFDTDISVLSLSSSKSMLANHCTIPLESSHSLENGSVENLVQPSQETLDLFRRFIHAGKYGPYDISEQVSEYIQNSFVQERKVATENKTELPTQEELMHRMNLARLAAASFGEANLTQERYDYVVDLDNKRKSRIASSSSAPQPNK